MLGFFASAQKITGCILTLRLARWVLLTATHADQGLELSSKSGKFEFFVSRNDNRGSHRAKNAHAEISSCGKPVLTVSG